jgi:streptogramin lyase
VSRQGRTLAAATAFGAALWLVPSASAAIVEFRMPTGSPPMGITVGQDGNLWASQPSGNVARIARSGAITEFPLDTSTFRPFPGRITTGPSAAVWIGESSASAGAVTQVAADGSTTQFSSGITNQVEDITVGPDLNLWFTEPRSGIVAQMTPSGTVTEFLVGGAPTRISRGADGNLWFTDAATRTLDRMTTTGAVTLAVPGPVGSTPTDVTVGPDGTEWTTLDAATGGRSMIGRVEPDGTLSTLVVARDADQLTSISPGPDGNLWFTDAGVSPGGNGTAGIGRLTLAGDATIFRTGLPANSRPVDITPGPDGNLWFADASNGVGRIPPNEPPDGPAVAPPVLGKSVDVAPVSGTVLVRARGARRFTRLKTGEQIPVGSDVDTTRGRVTLTSARSSSPATQSILLYAGLFRVRQLKAANAFTDLDLEGPIGPCSRSGGAKAARKRKKRGLWGSGNGKVRTNGKDSSGTVNDPVWLTEDSCAGTRTVVRSGTVTVRDFTRRRTVKVTAGRQYLAPAP